MDSKTYPSGSGGIKFKYIAGGILVCFNGLTGTEIYRVNPANGVVTAAKFASGNGGVVLNQRFSKTTAEVNTGVTLLPAVSGFKYRIIDWSMIAVGGNAATATSVDIIGTRTTESRGFVVAVAALTRSTVVKPNSANVTVLADGASFTQYDANTAVTLGKQSGGSNLGTATGIDLVLTYAVEAA